MSGVPTRVWASVAAYVRHQQIIRLPHSPFDLRDVPVYVSVSCTWQHWYSCSAFVDNTTLRLPLHLERLLSFLCLSESTDQRQRAGWCSCLSPSLDLRSSVSFCLTRSCELDLFFPSHSTHTCLYPANQLAGLRSSRTVKDGTP